MKTKFFRISALIICLIMIFSLCSCKGNSQDDVSSVAQSNPSSVGDVTSEDASSEETTSENASSQAVSSAIITDNAVRQNYKPIALTVSFYEASSGTYGFTWNAVSVPLKPVLQVCEGKTFNANSCKEYTATAEKYETLDIRTTNRGLAKAQVTLKANTYYTYRAYDKDAEIGSEPVTFKTVDYKAKSFSFVHASDTNIPTKSTDSTHSAIGTGAEFGKTLAGISKTNPNSAFILHSGNMLDNVHETYWRSMFEDNAKYLSKTPVMLAAGKKEANDKNAIFEHFNVKITDQDVSKGMYYTYDIGDCKFIVLNTNLLGPNGELATSQYNWLKRTLEGNTKKWTIVSMHTAIYSTGSGSLSSGATKIREQVYKLFTRYNVDLVLQGNDYVYSKTYPILDTGAADRNPEYEVIDSVKYTVNPKGTIYAVHGSSGNLKGSPTSSVDMSLFELSGKSNPNSWADISIDGNKLTVKVMYLDNGTPKLWNSYGILKK